ncbi:unnamed protein product [Musa textilis]
MEEGDYCCLFPVQTNNNYSSIALLHNDDDTAKLSSVEQINTRLAVSGLEISSIICGVIYLNESIIQPHLWCTLLRPTLIFISWLPHLYQQDGCICVLVLH